MNTGLTFPVLLPIILEYIFIITGADDLRQDFAKDIGSAMAGMPDSFDSDLFLSDELKDGLDPLDLQMLTDPTINVTDPATEDSFRMDRL